MLAQGSIDTRIGSRLGRQGRWGRRRVDRRRTAAPKPQGKTERKTLKRRGPLEHWRSLSYSLYNEVNNHDRILKPME